MPVCFLACVKTGRAHCLIAGGTCYAISRFKATISKIKTTNR